MDSEERKNRAIKLLNLMESEGGKLLLDEINGRISDSSENLMDIMLKNPEGLTERIAIRSGLEVQILSDLKGWLECEAKFARQLTP